MIIYRTSHEAVKLELRDTKDDSKRIVRNVEKELLKKRA